MSDHAFLPPHNKPPCLILVKDLMRITQSSDQTADPGKSLLSGFEKIFACSGCQGIIRFAHKTLFVSENDNYVESLTKILSRFPIFEGIEVDDIKDMVSFLKVDRYAGGDIVLKKGNFGRFLFIILSGTADVLDGEGMSIASMGKGAFFGEMSLFSGVPVGATIKVRKSAVLLRIHGDDFKNLLNRFSALQMNFIRLMVHRVSEINLTRMNEFVCGVTGKLSEISPSDLFQTFNVSEKTGVLTLKLPGNSAYLSFREGQLINVKYCEKEGEEAFFELLKQKTGRFKYSPGLSPEEMRASELGDFMGLLIEGLRRIDEEDREFLRTVIPTLI